MVKLGRFLLDQDYTIRSIELDIIGAIA